MQESSQWRERLTVLLGDLLKYMEPALCGNTPGEGLRWGDKLHTSHSAQVNTTVWLFSRITYKVAAAVVRTCPRLIYSKVSQLPVVILDALSHTYFHPPCRRTAVACSLGWWTASLCLWPLPRNLPCKASARAREHTSTMYITLHTSVICAHITVSLAAVHTWPTSAGTTERWLCQKKG